MKNTNLYKWILIAIISSFCFINNSNGQSDIAGTGGTGHIYGSGYYLGWDANSGHALEIRQDNITVPFSIEFWTKQIKQMELNGSTGNLGIGNSVTTNPPWKLTVENDIDIVCPAGTPPNEGYRYNHVLILSAPGTDNLLCGLYAGSNVTGNENTMLGSLAGNTTSSGSSNTFLGA